jgi:hypothetical protein
MNSGKSFATRFKKKNQQQIDGCYLQVFFFGGDSAIVSTSEYTTWLG